jgi:hypothetical protein
LEAFSRVLDFDQFRPDLEQALAYSDGQQRWTLTDRSGCDVQDLQGAT